MNELRLISSNIRFANTEDHENSWDNRKLLLAETLLDFSPHIIGSQEGRKPQLEDLKKNLKDYDLISQHRPWIEERMYPCIFIKKEWAKILESGDLWLSDTPCMPGSKSFDSAFPRLATWALIELNKNKKIFIITTHLDHISSVTRQKQIGVLINELKNYITTYPTILMGDFNEDPMGKTRELLFQSHLKLNDPWITLNLKEEGSYHSFNGANEKNTARIDWILHTQQFKPISIELDKRHSGTMYPSDHYPVKCKLNFGE